MFEDAKVGDRVWDFVFGWGTIYDIISDDYYPIKVEFEKDIIRSYTLDGALFKGSKENPSLFWDEIKFEIPKRPKKQFSLENELRKLEITEFRHGRDNYFLVWSNKYKHIDCYCSNSFEYPFVICFTKESIENFLENIKDKNISKGQFFKAYKNVFGGKYDRGIN